MELLLLGIGAAVVAVVGGRRWRGSQVRHRGDRAELDAARQVAEEDVICFGEDLPALRVPPPGARALQVAAEELRTALAAYESALERVDALHSTDEVSRVVDTLTVGRFALACAKARIDGAPVPSRRTPCFFNPQHGPSVADVRWTRTGLGHAGGAGLRTGRRPGSGRRPPRRPQGEHRRDPGAVLGGRRAAPPLRQGVLPVDASRHQARCGGGVLRAVRRAAAQRRRPVQKLVG